jgi:Transposase, Mutator family
MSVVLPQHFTSRLNNWPRVRAILETIGEPINYPFSKCCGRTLISLTERSASRSFASCVNMITASVVGRMRQQDGLREILGMGIGPSEAEAFWTAFLRQARDLGRPTKASRSRSRLSSPPPSPRMTPKRPELSGAGSPTSSVPSCPSSPPFMDEAEADVLAYMTLPVQHRAKLYFAHVTSTYSRE